MSKKERKVTVLIVPDFEGTPHTFRVSITLIRLGLMLAFVGFVLLIIIALSWVGLLRKSNLVDRLTAENQQYRAEQEQVAKLETRVRELQHFQSQICRALGADKSSNNGDDIFASLIVAQADSEDFQPGSKVPISATRPLTVSSHLPPMAESPLRREADIPSLWPVEGVISQGFEWNPIVPGRSHPGVDIAGMEGAVVKATAGGIVVWTGWSARYGNLIVLAHSNGYFSVYGHNRIILVKPRERVARGDPIALLGSTGQSSAPHLHFEIWWKDQPLDPLDLLITS